MKSSVSCWGMLHACSAFISLTDTWCYSVTAKDHQLTKHTYNLLLYFVTRYMMLFSHSKRPSTDKTYIQFIALFLYQIHDAIQSQRKTISWQKIHTIYCFISLPDTWCYSVIAKDHQLTKHTYNLLLYFFTRYMMLFSHSKRPSTDKRYIQFIALFLYQIHDAIQSQRKTINWQNKHTIYCFISLTDTWCYSATALSSVNARTGYWHICR